MIIDFHTHIFEKSIRDHREAYFPSESAFELLYSNPGSRLAGAKSIIKAMDEQGVDKSIVFGFPWKNEDLFKRHNDYILESVAKYPQRLIGFGCFDPFHKNAVSETERCLQGGLSGIGELAFYQTTIDEETIEKLTPIMGLCLEGDLPVLIHINEPVGHMYPGKARIAMDQIDWLIQSFPKNKIVLAHWGGGFFFFNLLKREMKGRLSHVYFDTAASPFLYDPEIYQVAIRIIGKEKILFGSDFPLLSPQRYFDEMKAAGLSEEAMDCICGTNAAGLLNREKEVVL